MIHLEAKLGIVKLFHVGVMESDPAFKNVIDWLSVVVAQAKAGGSFEQASLIYRAIFRMATATQRHPVSKNKKNQNGPNKPDGGTARL